MKKPVVVIGMGEMGDLFARGFLKIGHPVYPLLRGMDAEELAAEIRNPELVLVAVGEHELHSVLEGLPEVWRDRLGLLQNELLPSDWLSRGIADPTVIVVWFDKKKNRPFVNVLPTPLCGPRADLVLRALQAVEVPCFEVPPEALLYELARKSLYILTINIVGIVMPSGASVGELWEHHRELAEKVAGEIMDIQAHLMETPLPRARLMAGMLEGFDGDPGHICMGRSAALRLRRALRQAERVGVETPALRRIADAMA
ncbi:hypothetical protein [Methylococcus sp. EFPC2]|uniref:hypothetical protein n=1 Tax=Methylococcus sp. EFPC2 TaxID=2812648 RepID=UPI0019686858|nr:hypothetical protein [Methylococcus sp. EFPC2]QSA96647.1 hypothetical protein JWZ97_15745 [Methylococcus sp. EFPC2]